jgi:hypothetical protein
MSDKSNNRKREESLVVGRFGEAFLAFCLIKSGIKVLNADTAAFDLMAMDNSGRIFPADKIVGISIKTRTFMRYSTPYQTTANFTIPFPRKIIEEEAKLWKIVPWVGLVIATTTSLTAYLFPYKIFRKVESPTRPNFVWIELLYKYAIDYPHDEATRTLQKHFLHFSAEWDLQDDPRINPFIYRQS